MSTITETVAASDRGVLILASLAGGDKHGYALMLDIDVFAGVKLGPGTLYGAINKLEDDGLIEALPSGDRRRPYAITDRGREVLQRQLTESARIARVGLRRLSR